ncbi:MAG: prepilin-type N-terminal cleavage/methylation domain-containing protein [bacterium]
MHKKSFTLIEIVVVLVIIGILLAMIPWRLRGTQEQAKMALVMQQWEDLRQHTVIHMRE